MTALSARWTAPQLVTALSAAGWGSLDGREWQGVRSVMNGLIARLPHRSAQGLTTAEQVAAAAGLSERWTRRCLDALETIGLIEWRRGGIVNGKPQPSFLRIIKRRLVELIEEARPERARAIAARRAQTEKRLAGLRKLTVKPRRLKLHAELSASPIPLRGGATRAPAPDRGSTSEIEVPEMIYDEALLPRACRHGAAEPRACALCKRDARTPEQIAEAEAYEMTALGHGERVAADPETIARGVALVKAALSRVSA